ncbi:Uncharacterized protein PECH_003039 [Penicillium ucsense]|uniref:Uncharacterized protein n=1 Tax=Penicillium ucsense TaxID=2839758 RepID=A0A8J8W6W8_9EURO|nr:Uncharacterized protein PECM_008123 [Penicillium ucsense]KAF7730025.1 Uncharacterized protein PECH_003039 [Penicillium ucsense]
MAHIDDTPSADYDMSIKTLRLEREYEKTIADSARLLDAERDRVRRMEYLLLQIDRDALRATLEQAHEQIASLTESESETRHSLEEAISVVDSLSQVVNTAKTENRKLKEELSALNTTSTSNSGLLAEKVQLSRELAHAKSKLERLETQDTAHQAVVSEKQALERHLNMLELQLENEKHSHERTRVKGAEQASQMTKLLSMVDELQNELAREQRANQQRERRDQQQNGGWEKERSVMEAKIETLKKQLRSAKDKLQEARNDLQQRRSIVRNAESDNAGPEPQKIPLQSGGPSSDFHEAGIVIATPGAVRVKDKTNKPSALPGDKSSFSMTPFLNRTGPAPSEAPISSDIDEEEVRQVLDDSAHPGSKPGVARKSQDGQASVDEQPEFIKPARKPKATTAKAKAKGRGAKSTAANADRDMDPEPIRDVSNGASETLEDSLNDVSVEQGQTKVKRRKLAQRDRSLFEDDEEDEELLGKPRKPLLGGGRQSVLAAPLSVGLSRGGGFGASRAFSPLKRDRTR